MGDVPWALGRRAMIRWRIDPAGNGGRVSGWRVAIGVLEDLAVEVGRAEPLWVLDPSNDVDPEPESCVVEYRQLSSMERIPDRLVVERGLVPGQCPRCFESTRPHADGCMVAANLARGVPAFWTPWVMLVAPSVGTGFALYMLRTDGALVWLDRAESADAWILRARLAGLLTHPGERAPNALHVGFVALSSDGPTLAPWSKS